MEKFDIVTHPTHENQREEDLLFISPVTFETREYVENLSGHVVDDQAPWPEQLISALREIGLDIEGFEVSEQSPRSASVFQIDATGKKNEFVLTQSEACALLRNAFKELDSPDFGRVSPAGTPILLGGTGRLLLKREGSQAVLVGGSGAKPGALPYNQFTDINQ